MHSMNNWKKRRTWYHLMGCSSCICMRGTVTACVYENRHGNRGRFAPSLTSWNQMYLFSWTRPLYIYKSIMVASEKKVQTHARRHGGRLRGLVTPFVSPFPISLDRDRCTFFPRRDTEGFWDGEAPETRATKKMYKRAEKERYTENDDGCEMERRRDTGRPAGGKRVQSCRKHGDRPVAEWREECNRQSEGERERETDRARDRQWQRER